MACPLCYGESRAAADPVRDREEMIVGHLPLVKQIAGGIGSGLPSSVDGADLVSVGTLGLIRAVDQFDTGRGVEFCAFARQKIRGAILDHLRALDPLPYSTRVKVRSIESAIVALQHSFHRSPNEEEIAAETGFTVDEIWKLMDRARTTRLHSLDEFAEGEGLVAIAESQVDGGVEEKLERQAVARVLVRLIRDLPRAERLVLSLYYYEGLKMKDIGTYLDISESRVSQLHSRSVTELRARLRAALEEGS